MTRTVGNGHRRDCGCTKCQPNKDRIERCRCGHPAAAHNDHGCRACSDEPDPEPCGCKAYRRDA